MYGYHIVLTTHNSRTSARMVKYMVAKGPARILSLEEEIILTEIISTVIRENGYRCVSYNICQDHVHMIMVCKGPEELIKIVQKLKSISSKLFHRHPAVSKETTILHKNKLWSQKFFRASLDEWTLGVMSSRPGELYESSYLQKAISYIENNRNKHGLEDSEKLRGIISGFLVSLDEAYFNGS